MVRPSNPADSRTEQLIADILEFNPNADRKFLAGFDEEDLAAYLENLRHASDRNVRLNGWVGRQIAARKAAGGRKPIPRSNLRKAG
ncbi:MAG: hypothetical protein AAGD32_00370 [Planctomycetota bacterium]